MGWYPMYMRLGGPKRRSGRVQKISPIPGFDLRAFKSVVSCYTDYSNATLILMYVCSFWCVIFFIDWNYSVTEVTFWRVIFFTDWNCSVYRSHILVCYVFHRLELLCVQKSNFGVL